MEGIETKTPRKRPGKKRPKLRIMTYNVHGCSGTDGRVSPRRVARVIDAYDPDIIALQEIDLGRRRSRAEDQAAMIAKQLGLESRVSVRPSAQGEEHYGHALAYTLAGRGGETRAVAS